MKETESKQSFYRDRKRIAEGRNFDMADIAIIGAGSWGTALSLVLANNGHSVEIWSIVESEIEMLKEKHEHIDKLPGVKLPDSITFTTDIEETIKDNDILVLAVPSVFTLSLIHI